VPEIIPIFLKLPAPVTQCRLYTPNVLETLCFLHKTSEEFLLKIMNVYTSSDYKVWSVSV